MQRDYKSLITPIVEGLGYVVWHIEKHNVGRKILLRIYVDIPPNSDKSGVDLDDCSRISRQVGAMLDVEVPTLGNYILEVSSPGLNRSLYELEHYRHYVGSKVRVTLRQYIEDKRGVVGKIAQVLEDTICLVLADGTTIVLAIDDINRAKLIVDSLR